MQNPIKTRAAAHKPVIERWLSVGHSSTADLRHGASDDYATLTTLQAMRASGVAVMARVPWLDRGAILKVLDAGAYGVTCPMIDSREERPRRSTGASTS
jgi:4-hydroxy-2-oxoheptanedioate aldolase